MNELNECKTPSIRQVEPFMMGIEQLRCRLDAKEWSRLVRADQSIRQWRYFLTSDPYTRWGLLKPRGYPGDATLMDFAYCHDSVKSDLAAASPEGAQIYRYTSRAAQSQSARQRIELLRDKLRGYARQGERASVISFAAGHAREFETLQSAERSSIRRFTAVDLDAESLDTARQSAAGVEFHPVCRNVLRDSFDDLQQADLVYSLGLFDYLNDGRAQGVLEKMWQRVAPGGSLVVANLAHDAGNLAYCEAIMDWWMITRTDEDMRALGQFVGALDKSEKQVALARHGCFYYLEIRRAAG